MPGIALDEIVRCYRMHHQALLLGKTKHADIWAEFCSCLGRSVDIGILPAAFKNTPKNEAMFQLCRTLRKKYKTGIITDNSKERFEVLVEEMQLDRLFDALILSADIGATKHEPRIFEEALRAVNSRADECVFIDNDKNNLTVPAGMGFRTFWHDHEKNDFAPLLRQLKEWDVVMDTNS